MVDGQYHIDPQPEIKRYTSLLTPLFDTKDVSAYEYACCLLRVGGLQDAGWDPLLESKAMFDDTIALANMGLPHDTFHDVAKTQIRFLLIGYAHLIEMDAPYNVIANLLRVKARLPYCCDPFWHIRTRKAGKKKRPLTEIQVYPVDKIRHIKVLAEKAQLPQIASVFDEFYEPALRNSINHSDYVLHNDQIRLPHARFAEPIGTSSILSYPDLLARIAQTYAFYSSFFSLEHAACSNFKALKGFVFPFDTKLKGLLEYHITEDALIIGFCVHWPNKLTSYFRRDETGCKCCNIHFSEDLTVAFFVGESFRHHSSFSPLVPAGRDPIYADSVHNGNPLKWSEGPYEA